MRVDIPPAVRAINNGAFCGCSMLMTVHLDYGLEEIDDLAFCGCMSLVRINIPPVVRVIKHGAFAECSGLTTAIFNNGLEEIEAYAFHACTSLVCITIPSTVRVINEKAFHGCSGLTNVFFCNEIEEFVSGSSMRDWWNNGVHENCLSTYCFLVQCNILERVGLILPRMWHSEIYDMLQRIPSISPEGLQSHFRFIDSKLSVYDELKDSPALLELAIWKSKIVEQTDGVIYLLDADLKMVCCIDSLTMVGIFVPNILSFLRGNANEGNDDDEDDGDDDEDYGDDDNDDDNNDADDDGDDDDSDEDNGDGEDEY